MLFELRSIACRIASKNHSLNSDFFLTNFEVFGSPAYGKNFVGGGGAGAEHNLPE